MKELLSLVSKIHEKGCRFVVEALKENGAEGLMPSHGDILVCLYQYNKMTMKLCYFSFKISMNMHI